MCTITYIWKSEETLRKLFLFLSNRVPETELWWPSFEESFFTWQAISMTLKSCWLANIQMTCKVPMTSNHQIGIHYYTQLLKHSHHFSTHHTHTSTKIYRNYINNVNIYNISHLLNTEHSSAILDFTLYKESHYSSSQELNTCYFSCL